MKFFDFSYIRCLNLNSFNNSEDINKSKKEDSALPASMKNLITKYADVMANVGASDLEKYADYRRYNKKPTKGKGK